MVVSCARQAPQCTSWQRHPKRAVCEPQAMASLMELPHTMQPIYHLQNLYAHISGCATACMVAAPLTAQRSACACQLPLNSMHGCGASFQPAYTECTLWLLRHSMHCRRVSFSPHTVHSAVPQHAGHLHDTHTSSLRANPLLHPQADTPAAALLTGTSEQWIRTSCPLRRGWAGS